MVKCGEVECGEVGITFVLCSGVPEGVRSDRDNPGLMGQIRSYRSERIASDRIGLEISDWSERIGSDGADRIGRICQHGAAS